MSELRDFVADLLERTGAAIEAVGPDGLEALVPPPLQKRMGWPELAHLGFGTERAHGTIAIGLEGDWLDRFGALLADEGRWSERDVRPPAAVAPLGDPERVLEGALDLPNAVWRFQGMSATTTRCLMLAFRVTAISDEKRDGLIWLGFNLGTGAVISDVLARLRPALAQMPDWHAPDQATRRAAGPGWSAATLAARLAPLLDRQVRESMEPFLRAMRRRLDRDRNRVHAYHDDLRVTVECVQALDLYVPVQRLDVLIRRRKGERVIRLDWHPLVRSAELPLCEAGLGLDRVRLVCDDKLHLTDPAGQAPCASCGKPFCRACFPAACPRCRQVD